MRDADVLIRLSRDEALVLFEQLARHVDEDKPLAIECRAEHIVACSIQCALESELVEPLDPNYVALLAAARARIEATRS